VWAESAASGTIKRMDVETFLSSACALLAIPSTCCRPAELRRALDFVLDFVGPGFTVELFEPPDKPPSALLYLGTERPRFRVILNAHLDVVPAADEQFRCRRDGNRLYARGAHDMKVSALVEALVFRELAGVLPYPIGLQLVTDEEIGGAHGTLHQLKQGVTGQFVVVGENSELRVVNESKGRVTGHLYASGRSEHGAYPWLGDNALVKLIGTLDALLAAYPTPAEEAWRTTINVAKITTSNQSTNRIPADATAALDIRFPPEDSDLNGRTIAQITEFLGSFCLPGVTVVVDEPAPPHWAAPDSTEVAALQQATRRQGYSGDFLRKHGSSDARFYYQAGIDAVIFGIGGAGQHGASEYVDIDTVVPYYRALTDFLGELTPVASDQSRV
jgi:succinyl-diaminopimelate desuccinylase